jgi:hypothetical protein
MKRATLRLVHARAKYCCEYCQLPQEASSIPFEVDHIIAQKHRGKSDSTNLALACFFCNSAKGSNIAGRDPETDQLTRLFHPREDNWNRHFSWSAEKLMGLSDIGRTTIEVLRINDVDCLTLRRSLIAENIFPPPRLTE